ncbi:hypothetical protein BYT27DRAFT_7083760 [Phlegmacium glaucopus]|nr:hypothetical protein BYT27DRAFT_7083760 [Phlegmacium glaucopus]
MPPSNLQGLNIVHPRQEASDSQDLLAYPDLSAQLDLWTNLTFDSDEPYAHRHDDPKPSNTPEEDEGAKSHITGEKVTKDGHINVVVNQSNNPSNAAPQPFDINSFLANFAIEPYSGQPSQLSQLPSITPSLAQLLALHPNRAQSFSHAVSPQYNPPTGEKSVTINSEESFVPTKRARTRKESITSVDSPNYREDSVAPSDATGPTGNPLSPAEDKRRRNTAASARFRLKKKEREAALEGKAKELETKVNELERECEGLRRENGWLKGLVVGVTGAAQGSNASQGLAVASPPPATISRTKRRRGEPESI